MNLKQQLTESMKVYMKAKSTNKLTGIRMAIAAIKNKEIEVRHELDEAQVLNVIKRQIKEHNDSLSYLEDNESNRSEIAKYNEYINALSVFIPEEMPEEEAKAILEALLAENNITAKSQMGPAMKLAKPALEGKIDNSKISKLVKEILI